MWPPWNGRASSLDGGGRKLFRRGRSESTVAGTGVERSRVTQNEVRDDPWRLAVHQTDRRVADETERVSRFLATVDALYSRDAGTVDKRVAGVCSGKSHVCDGRISVQLGARLGRVRVDWW